MDGIGDYFYLIVLVIAGLSSLFKNKKETTNSETAPKTSKKNWEDVLRELTPISVDKQTKTVVVKRTEEVPKTFVEGTSSMKDRSPVSNMVSTHKIISEEDKILTTEECTDIQINLRNNARSAFIYSEIFNRKY
jgi:hypothetical protein